jgi:hypothetical protein
MKRISVVFGLSLLVVLMGSQPVQAISAGPGGRLYECNRMGTSGNWTTPLYIMEYDENWDPVAGNLGEISHGSVYSSTLELNYKGETLKGGNSPEVEVPGGRGYGTLVMGHWYDEDTSSYGASFATMDVLRITPNATGMTVTQLGDGRAASSPDNFMNTDRGYFAMPDPAGQFTGSSDHYLTSHVGASYVAYVSINEFSDGSDTDLTDEDADYVDAGATISSASGDTRGFGHEIVEDTLYYRSGTSVRYNVSSGGATPTIGDGAILSGATVTNSKNRLAAGLINGHHAVYDEVSDTIWAFIDFDDDGDMDDTGEAFEVYNSTDVDNVVNDPIYVGDLELVTGFDGKKFLMVCSGAGESGYGWGSAVFVLELDNTTGDFTLGNAGYKLLGRQRGNGVADPVLTLPGMDWKYGGWCQIEFDVIPEPGTLLLLGTGILGVLGYLRRRTIK